MVIFWLLGIILLSLLEALTTGLYAIWFVLGGVAALLAALLHASLSLQITLFLVVSALALLATRPLVKKFGQKTAAGATNLDHILGQTVPVREAIAGGKSCGAVYVDGKIWSAESADGSPLAIGETVQILRIEGVRLLVQKSKILEEVK